MILKAGHIVAFDSACIILAVYNCCIRSGGKKQGDDQNHGAGRTF
jgi:hypothetical protein